MDQFSGSRSEAAILLHRTLGREPAARRAGSARIGRIVRENRPISLSDFFGAGSKPKRRSMATEHNAPVWNQENAESAEEFAPRAEIRGRIKLHSPPPQFPK